MPDSLNSTSNSPTNKTTKQVMALDFGKRRIGVAVGNTMTANPQALTTIINSKDTLSIPNELLALLKEWKPDKLIMGIPYNADGSKSVMDKQIRRFATLLTDKIDMPVEFIDESYTSSEASKQFKYLRQSGQRKNRVQKADIDKAAAAIMLQRWFDQNSY